jgi:hypothetical protein
MNLSHVRKEEHGMKLMRNIKKIERLGYLLAPITLKYMMKMYTIKKAHSSPGI